MIGDPLKNHHSEVGDCWPLRRARPKEARKYLAKNTMTPDDLVEGADAGLHHDQGHGCQAEGRTAAVCRFRRADRVVPKKIDASRFVMAF